VLVLPFFALAGYAAAAAPTPDPPPLAVAPDWPSKAAAPKPMPATVVRPDTSQRPAATLPAAPEPRVTTARKAKPKPVAKVPTKPVVRNLGSPHDRVALSLPAAAVVVEPLRRGLLVFAGVALALAALGGGVVLLVARRQLTELAR
jgi:hypothetical protein